MSVHVRVLIQAKDDPFGVDIIEMDIPNDETLTVDFLSGKVTCTSRNPPVVSCSTCRKPLTKGEPHDCTP